jgi:hypothetical protein
VSKQHSSELVRIQEEFDAAVHSVAFVLKHSEKHPDLTGGVIDVGAVQRAAQNLESTYIVRLTALFEAMLEIHLATQHASLTLPEITNGMFLLNTVVSRYGGVIPERARAKCELALRVRNGIAHGRPDPTLPNMTFQEALAALNWVAQFLKPYP